MCIRDRGGSESGGGCCGCIRSTAACGVRSAGVRGLRGPAGTRRRLWRGRGAEGGAPSPWCCSCTRGSACRRTPRRSTACAARTCLRAPAGQTPRTTCAMRVRSQVRTRGSWGVPCRSDSPRWSVAEHAGALPAPGCRLT
eukprot:scaffold125619_cov39-Phaeocystis_antarctica.AAC.1